MAERLAPALEDGLPVASTVLLKEAEEEGISYPTLRRAKKALHVLSHKRGEGDEHWDWQLPGLRVIPQPTPLLSLASLEPLEHVQVSQSVSGETEVPLGAAVTPDGAEVPVPCGCGHAHAPGAYPPEVIENREDTQETHDEQAAEEPPPAPMPPVATLPMFCPRCHQRPTWLKRGDYPVCHNCKAPYRGR